MRTIDRLLKWVEWPIQVFLWVGLAACFLMMIHVSVDVTGRTVFNHPFAGTTEIVSAWYMVTVAYLPWAYLSRTNNHIIAGIFSRIGTPLFSFWVEIGVKLLVIVYLSVFTYQTFFRAIQQMRAGEVWEAAGGYIIVWPSRWLLPFAAGLMLVYLVLRVVADVTRGHQPETSEAK